ncbi:thiamine pyrophosphate-binding protein [Pelagibaculum spongiae]|uniref:Acetolactate synthase large subunit n=1 Tax=Pelagibaculum spongiae TaxID=2080658 RepID=A0A2V1H147_9GAMM|nr:thiamine pyrophosphate-binding protein [Pelagibaculum spongiae]PVZ69752.1 acetolactate synthase large subunit [Pelagibaculum spongiae]
MKKTGAWLVRDALEKLKIKFTFGIPGVHNTELYDELNKSTSIKPILVTHEGCGAFMAEIQGRLADAESGHMSAMAIVPAAGAAYASTGIGEAFLDGIPMLVIAAGTRTDTGHSYQLHQMDQVAMMKPITKFATTVETLDQIQPTLYKAWQKALEGEPGPVFVEIPVNLLLFAREIKALPSVPGLPKTPVIDLSAVERAATLLQKAKKPGLFIGWGAKGAAKQVQQLAEQLGMPVATSLQGAGCFPANHPLHAGFAIGQHAVPASENAFADCDCLLAVGVRFGEIATGSFGMQVPDNLIHIDINKEVFSANYPAKIALHGDSAEVLDQLQAKITVKPTDSSKLAKQIANDKKAYLNEWLAHKNTKNRVNPARFFQQLRSTIDDDALVVADDGNHTFLTAELMPIHCVGGFISPTDFNCMGYCVPAAIGAKLAQPKRTVVGIVGDGCLMMTGLELVTAVKHQLGVMLFIFNDGELSQISQAQHLPYNRKTCTTLPEVNMQGLAIMAGAEYISIENDGQLAEAMAKAKRLSESDKPVLIDVKIDYSKQTRFTKGILKTNLKRIELGDKARMISRAVVRKVTG